MPILRTTAARAILTLAPNLEKPLKLTAREIDLISDITKTRRQRRLGAWISLAIVFASFVAALYLEWDLDGAITVLAIVASVAMTELTSEYFGTRTETRLQELLLRYVNNDPEAIQLISARSQAREVAS